MKKKIVKSEAEMIKAGAAFARMLKGGEVVLLDGDLGTGKTTFVRGMAKSLGVNSVVRSPTFTLLNIHKGKTKTLVHIDAYRLKNIDLHELGVDEFVGKKDVIVVIEWGERVCQLFGEVKCIMISYQHGKLLNERIISYETRIFR